MKDHFFEMLSLLIAAGAFSIAFITLKHRFKKDEQQRHKLQLDDLLSHTEWKKNIEFDIQKIKLETEEIRTTRSKNLSEIWEAIECVKKEHDKDMKDIGHQFGEMMKEIRLKNEEIIKLVTEINNTVIKLTTQFQDHKDDHNKKDK